MVVVASPVVVVVVDGFGAMVVVVVVVAATPGVAAPITVTSGPHTMAAAATVTLRKVSLSPIGTSLVFVPAEPPTVASIAAGRERGQLVPCVEGRARVKRRDLRRR